MSNRDTPRGRSSSALRRRTQRDLAPTPTGRGSRRYDLVVDIGGNSRLSRLRRALTPTGTLVIVGGEEGGKLTGGFDRQLRASVLSLFVRQRLTMLVSKEHHSYLDELRPLLAAGQVTPAVDTTYPLADVPDAMRHLTAGHARGKIAITT